jgi:hypothetical protein
MTTPPKSTPSRTRTERRLVASIRKAKSGAEQPGDAEPAGAETSAGATALAPVQQPKSTEAGTAARPVARKRPASGAAAVPTATAYQSRRRVWPD